MKKIIASLTILAMALSVLGPALVKADITTGLTKGQGGGSAPIIKAKWEMKGPCFTGNTYNNCVTPGVGEGKDDSTNPYTQLAPPGVWDAKMNYTVCAIATDPNGVDDIVGVYADIYYPSDLDGSYHIPAIHADPAKPDQVNGGVPGTPDYGIGGCDAFIEENTLIKLDIDDGYRLFCEAIYDSNNNLPIFFGSYTYNEICGAQGELMKGTARVYCDDKILTWEDPAGAYVVKIFAQDTAGNSSTKVSNQYLYQALTGYEVDFTNVAYGEVLLNVHKLISGDISFGTADKPTVRNRGNTRLNMLVAQDDMALGQSSGVWNVQYDARVGNNAADWDVYNPFKLKAAPGGPASYQELEDILDLSETEEMDFSILVKKWPDTATNYNGFMWLSAEKAMFRVCPGG